MEITPNLSLTLSSRVEKAQGQRQTGGPCSLLFEETHTFRLRDAPEPVRDRAVLRGELPAHPLKQGRILGARGLVAQSDP